MGEYRWFRRIGVRLFQGYLFGRPAFEALPQYRAVEMEQAAIAL